MGEAKSLRSGEAACLRAGEERGPQEHFALAELAAMENKRIMMHRVC